MRRRLFVLGVVIQAAVLIGWAASLEWARAGAVTIRLETAPVDPRELLRGDYVQLSYKISEIPLSAFAGERPGSEHTGFPVYVALAPRGAVHEAVAASLDPARLTLQPGQLRLVGTLAWQVQGRGARVTYGIERYYVPEGKGVLPRGTIEAEVAVTADGRPFLTRLFVDGRPYP